MTDQTSVEGGLDEPAELEPEQGSLDLAAPGDDWTAADWEREAAAVLRKAKRLGAEDADELVWSKLTRRTLDGIDITPLGTPALLEDLETSGRPTRQGDWDIRAHVDGRDAKRAHEEAMVDLDGGVTSLWLTGETDYAVALDGVLVDLAPVVLDGGDPEAFLSYVGDRELHPGTNLGVPAADATAELGRRAWQAGVRAFVIDASQIHDRGASDVQELAWSMAEAAAYLRRLTDAGLSVDEAAGLVEFRYAATDEQFPTIAKLRAARRLWARVLEMSEASPRTGEMRQHAVTSRPMMSKYDPWVNMLRTTVAAFAAGVGGADSVTVLPFDGPLGRPDALGRRIARNTSHLLVDEAHVAHVADPAGGSYAVERLTDDLARAAWQLFARLDEADDRDDVLDAEISATVGERERQIATRRRPITGLTEFPNLGEALPERDGEPDPVRRYGASFEALRDEPAATPVHLATLGTVAQHTARATFATNLLAAGGIAVSTEADGLRVVCVAGTDAAYDEEGADVAARLREGGAEWIIIAGKPRDWADDSCAMGVDALDFLTRTREKLA